MRGRVSYLALAAVSLAAIHCVEDPLLSVPAPNEYALPATTGPMDRIVECDEAPHGTPCGQPGSDTHCIYDACVENACGDDVRAGFEACDDGNELEGDGCNERCEIEQCGDAKLDVGEDCDDGNADEDDGCSSGCELVQPGVDDDAGVL